MGIYDVCVTMMVLNKHIFKNGTCVLDSNNNDKNYAASQAGKQMLKTVADLLYCTGVQAIHSVAVILTPLAFRLRKRKPVQGSVSAQITLHISFLKHYIFRLSH